MATAVTEPAGVQRLLPAVPLHHHRGASELSSDCESNNNTSALRRAGRDKRESREEGGQEERKEGRKDFLRHKQRAASFFPNMWQPITAQQSSAASP